MIEITEKDVEDTRRLCDEFNSMDLGTRERMHKYLDYVMLDSGEARTKFREEHANDTDLLALIHKGLSK